MAMKDMRIGIVGAGVMGIGIAQIAALAGHPVLLLDAREGAAAQAIEGLAVTLAKLVDKGKLEGAARDGALARLQIAADVQALAGCGLVIEVIVEKAEPKQALLRELDALLPAEAILASNTSSISITLLGNGLRHPERLVGMHFFNPVPLMQLVEVVSGAETSNAVAAQIEQLARAWGKTPVHAASTPGFIVNRIARPYYAETLALLQEQAGSPAQLDDCLRSAGFRMGPCELTDLIGQDTNNLVTRSVWEANFGDRRYQPSLVQQALVDGGRLGRKAGKGFYVGEPVRLPAVAAPAQPPQLQLLGEGPLVDAWAARLPGIARVADPRPGLRANGQALRFSDGRCAYETGEPVLDWLVHAKAEALAVAFPDAAADRQLVADALACAGLRAVELRDTPGLLVARTLAMLVNEANDAVWQGVCSPEGADTAMRLGLNYPAGPFDWQRLFGSSILVGLLDRLWFHYRSERYRVSPPLRRAAPPAEGISAARAQV
jgi:3-hydroxybutyryl-CoA dehydrogenase